MKKMNNKGFSLVELIIVIAIMAVLMGVLAPQLLKYVEDSRVQSDETALSEVENAVKIALANEKIYNAVGTGTTVTIKDDDSATAGTCSATSGVTELDEELAKVIPDGINFTSKKYNGNDQTITITFDSSMGTFKLTHSWGAAASATP